MLGMIVMSLLAATDVSTTSAPILLPQDTPVELMAMTEVSTASAKPGTVIKLRVNRAIEIDGKVVVPVGTPAFGEVTEAKSASGLGKTGAMRARLVRIQYGDAAIPIEGDASAKGTKTGSVGVTVLMTGLVGLFNRGNNAKIKAGEIVAGFVAEDVSLDLSPTPHRIAPPALAAAAP